MLESIPSRCLLGLPTVTGDGLGPAFDTGTLSTPTPRKLVGCWMEQAGRKTVIVPEVWRELTQSQGPAAREYPKNAWRRLAERPDSPFVLPSLSEEQEEAAYDIRSKFTSACFPGVHPVAIHTHGDALVVSQSLALGTDILVTGDIRTIDHYEINLIVRQLLGRNAPFVTTLDQALCEAYPGGRAVEQLLILAMSTVAPVEHEPEWQVDGAHQSLDELRRAMVGAGLTATAQRLDARWNECRDLTAMLGRARAMAEQSHALRCERLRTDMHRAGLAALKEPL